MLGGEAFAQSKKKRKKGKKLNLKKSLEDESQQGECTVECCPPTTTQQITVGAGAVVITLVLAMTFRWLIEKSFINNSKPAALGRNAGVSLGLFLGAISLGLLSLTITGCFPITFILWGGFLAGVWVIHLIYTVIATLQS